MHPKLYLVLFAFCALVLACEDQAGIGGRSTLEGRIMAREFNNTGDLIRQYPAADERVYIIYGDNDFYDDDLRTHFDGRFRFEFLNPGSYTVYAYSDCDTCAGGQEAVLSTIEIEEPNETVVMPDIFITK